MSQKLLKGDIVRPLNVFIKTNEEGSLSAGRNSVIICSSVGSRPAARLTWYMEGRQLMNYTEEISTDQNMTTSNLTFIPTVRDNGKQITCRAENSKIQGSAVEDSLKLDVDYVPMVNLSFGSNVNPKDIEEGNDVYFDCKVDANPAAYKVVWKHNGIVLQNNPTMGKIVQQTSLALQKVSKSQAGNYTCIASNVEGDGYSNSVQMNIMYKPLCLPGQKNVYGVAKGEEAQIACRVEAYPEPTVFRWAFNNTEGVVEMPEERFKNSTHGSLSVLAYKPKIESEYGTLLCWADNFVGAQINACVFHVIAAGKPEPPYNCTLINQTTQSLSVECTPGFDGGQTQHFQLEVYDQITGQLRANVSARDNAVFSVHNLEPGRILRMAVYAVNARGRSEPSLLEGFTLKVAEKQTVRVLFTGTHVPFEITPILGILISVIAALLLCTVSILLALKVRSDRRAQRPGDLPLKKSSAPSSEDLYDPDDRNPDVIPINKDSDYQLTGSTAGTPLAVQSTPDGLSTTSLPLSQQPNHLPSYSHNDYNNYPTLPLSGEVTYAELCLTRPSTLTSVSSPDGKLGSLGGLASLAGFNGSASNGNGGVIVGGKPSYPKDSTIYACIDHNARPPPPSVPITPASSHYSQQQSSPSPAESLKQPHPREIVTVRTPLISSQESCV
ncbi:hypothetical protein QAD02_004784 [Eretmocerus hayati]|uniref:Uncharacterized protein n=1 Tax=Eretmocerus hayati TaxID=131215 RepID=A0ACC2NQX5_9HYME|nr:hypothetical protein QAD02_004784 [Eretmocerus hayati]